MSWLGMLCWSATAAVAGAPGAAPEGTVISTWQHHTVTFSYTGFTTLYTCDGLEDHVRQLLLHVGARDDAHVRARGCFGPFNAPSRDAWVDADFSTLAPAADPSTPAGVNARWGVLHVEPLRPRFVGAGDCELIQAMKDLITRNFSLRDVRYRTDCIPHQVSLDSFAVDGQSLREVPPAGKASRESAHPPR